MLSKVLFTTWFVCSVSLLGVFFCSTSCSYFRELQLRGNKAEVDLDTICKKMPPPQDFIETDSNKTVDIAKVAFFKHYKSRSACKIIGNHYRDYFLREGWDKDRMKEEQSGGGMRTLDFIFRDGEYVVWVECQNDVNDDAEKQISVSCSWGLRPNN
jgi:hypothetical protein